MKKITFIAGILMLGLATSCSDEFLETRPKAALSIESLKNRAGVNYLLTGAYSLVDGVGAGTTTWHGSADNWIYGSVASDDAYKGTIAGDQPEISLIEQKLILPDNNHFRGKWQAVYDGVARANDVLLLVDQVDELTDAEKTQIKAQARFLRGHFHFEAKKMWNMVPYIDEAAYKPDDLNSTRVPNDKDIWPNIEADFKNALDNLPETQTQKGRATKWAAAAMLGKAYLYQRKWAEAKAQFDAIVNSGRYKLMERYSDNFRAVTNNNAESIFEVQHSVNDGAPGGENGNAGATLNYPYGGGGVTTCCGFYQPTQNLVNSFKTQNGLPLFETFNNSDVKNDQGIESNQPFTPDEGEFDPRLDHTVGRRGIPFLDWGVHPGKLYVRDQAYGGPYSPRKHLMYRSDVGTNTFSGNPRLNANNYRMIRYAHVLLMLAEAEVELGNLERARELVNMVRKRAANPEGFVKTADGKNAANYVIKEYAVGDPAFSNAANARTAVRFETRLELAMEGHRFFDLVRWGIADQVLNAYYAVEKNKRTYFNGVTFTKGKHEYYPIPLQEIVNSQMGGKATLKQNPGY
ncbi:RagB/SusD family nutrient uptake outer membrane protein [Telluribacter sp. SYSU D00476]|uniref:RagB/SusD family nutrient uptake outer membrane protein n=1 Tax=Telluribacter sp. SYSU D00476 TaxID=2811430 RepID=UPI001FF23B00|nr:RagB/SusD family nutrient uptake outer membrane protein [Telluribacter sp. SYSU D00476]